MSLSFTKELIWALGVNRLLGVTFLADLVYGTLESTVKGCIALAHSMLA